jgi:hypothetical protein
MRRSLALATVLFIAATHLACALEQGSILTVGRDHNYLKIVQVIDGNSMLVSLRSDFDRLTQVGGQITQETDTHEELVLIKGNTSGMTDGKWGFWLDEKLLVDGTYQYTTAGGTTKTVAVLKHLTAEELAAHEAKLKAEAEAYLTREWKDDTGKHSFVGKFLAHRNGRVQLERKETGKVIEVPMLRLSDEDQKWVRNELKSRSQKAKEQKEKEKKEKVEARQRARR